MIIPGAWLSVLEWVWTCAGSAGLIFSIFVIIDAIKDFRIVRHAQREEDPTKGLDPRYLAETQSSLAQETIAIFLIYGPGLTIGGVAIWTPNATQAQPLGFILAMLMCIMMVGTASKSAIRWANRRFQMSYAASMNRHRRSGDSHEPHTHEPHKKRRN